MARKTYISRNSVPHFSLSNNQRIAFNPSINNKAYFVTSDESLQKMIEAHPWYKKKFILSKTEEDVPKQAAATTESVKEVKNEDMHFATLADAKNYLATQFGAVRSNIKTQEAAMIVGKANGVNITIG